MGLTRKAETHVSLLVLLKQFFNPLLSGAWWFVTVYIIVLFNSPLINKIIKNKSKRSFSVALILMWMIGYTLPCFEEAAYFEIYRGVFFYCVGAYIKQSGKSITANIDTLKANLKEKKTALKKAEKEVATLEAKNFSLINSAK